MSINNRELSSVIVFDKYAKYLPDENRRERFEEIVQRNLDMHLRTIERHNPPTTALLNETKRAYARVLEGKLLPSMRSMQFGGAAMEKNHARCYNCFGRETRFITSEGVRSFEDFNDGDELLVLTHLGRWRKAVVRNYGLQPLNNVTIARSVRKDTVRATPNHRWIKVDGTSTTTLAVGDHLWGSRDIFSEFDYASADAMERLYWCYGYVYGDGTVVRNFDGTPRSSMVRLCGADKAAYLDRFTEMGFPSSTSASLGGDCMVFTGKYFKTAPDPSIDSPELVRAFVAGYLAADGNKVTCATHLSKYRRIVATGEHRDTVRNLFPIAGVFVNNETDLTGKETNFGVRGESSDFGITTNVCATRGSGVFRVASITAVGEDDVWCLEVEEDHSFVLECGVATGNCGFAPISDLLVISEIFYLLLCGVGMGYSVRKEHVSQLPSIFEQVNVSPVEAKIIVIEDSIEGWADGVKELLEGFVLHGYRNFVFDTNKVRARGVRLSSGGRAPGPEPLVAALNRVLGVLKEAAKNPDGKITPLQAHDIICHLSNAVMSGGIRRAAMIALFSPDDEEMMHCKDWSVLEFNQQRFRANNSVYLLRDKTEKDVFERICKIGAASGTGEPGVFWSNDTDMGTNPCAEVSLYPYQFCNLVEINAQAVEGETDFLETCRSAAVIGTLQASYTDFIYLSDRWKEQTDKERLIGVSITGVVSQMCGGTPLFTPGLLKQGAEAVKAMNGWAARQLGIAPAARCTTMKPAGTTSLVFGSASGVSAWHAPHYLRRVRYENTNPLAMHMQKHFPLLCEASKEYGKQHTEVVIMFPCKAPGDNPWTRHEDTAKSMLDRVTVLFDNWIKGGHRRGSNMNNVSCTVYMREHEHDYVADWLWCNREYYNGISVYPFSDAKYEQAPFEDCSKTTYEGLVSYIVSKRDILGFTAEDPFGLSYIVENEDYTNHEAEAACAGGHCAII